MRFLVSLALVATVALAAGPVKEAPLAGLPSKPGPHVEKIKALGDNQWLNLGAPAADPKWGKARGSSWGAKALVLAPDRRGAFLFGEGVHAFVKPNGHAMDDLWFYDINAHAWICLYPGMNTKTFTQRVKDKELQIDERGLLIDRDMQPIPVHTLIHAWGFLSYDTDRKKFAFLGSDGLGRYYMPGLKQMEEGLKLLEEQKKDKKKSLYSPWYYDVASGKFERFPATGSLGDAGRGFPQFHYLPSKKQFIVAGGSGVAFFDPVRNHWTPAKAKGAALKGFDRPGCYDSKRNRIYSKDGDGVKGKGQGLMAYDIDSNAWIELKPTGTAPPADDTNGAYYEYVPGLDLVVAIYFRRTPGIYAYNPSTNSWTGSLPLPADGPKFHFAANTCYDRELNAFFCHQAGDSADNGTIWVYRYRKTRE